MDLYPEPPQLSVSPTNPDHDQPFGDRELPAEIIREIYSWIIRADTTGVVLPLPVPPVDAEVPGSSDKVHGVYIASSCPLMRACKASRALYHSMLTHEILCSRYKHLQVLVRDFDFAPVVHGLISPTIAEQEQKANTALANLKAYPFTIHLIWTKAFLGGLKQIFNNPRREPLDKWLAYHNNDTSTTRDWSFTYTMDAVPDRYDQDLRDFLIDSVFFRRGIRGPELEALIEDLRPGFEDGSFRRDDSGEEGEEEEENGAGAGNEPCGSSEVEDGEGFEEDDRENFVYIWR